MAKTSSDKPKLWINETGSTDDGKRYGSGESEVYETCHRSRRTVPLLATRVRSLHVQCTTKARGPIKIGWVFEKRRKYDDCNETYLAETWVTLHDAPPTKTTQYHYHAM